MTNFLEASSPYAPNPAKTAAIILLYTLIIIIPYRSSRQEMKCDSESDVSRITNLLNSTLFYWNLFDDSGKKKGIIFSGSTCLTSDRNIELIEKDFHTVMGLYSTKMHLTRARTSITEYHAIN